MGRIWELRCDTWVHGYLIERDRFASRAHLAHLRRFSNGSATSPRPGFRELFLPPTFRQHQYRQSQPVRSIRSQGRLANRELVHSHKAHSRCCHQPQTNADRSTWRAGGSSADHPRHQHLSESTYRILSFASFILDTPARSPNSVLCSRLLHSTDPRNTSQPIRSSVVFTCITSQTNPQNPPGTSQASSRPVCGHLHISGRRTPTIPCEAPATRN
jgi:hypothetical protein